MRGRAMLLMVVGLIVASCGGGESIETRQPDVSPTVSSTTSTAPETTTTVPETTAAQSAPFHAIQDGSTVVWGTAVCDGSGDAGTNPEGGSGWLVWCELDMSDPRVSGSETMDRFRFMAGRVWHGTVWVAEDAEITNTGGTWRGSAQGAENDEAIPIGEAHYFGEGAYAGLEFHYYFFDSPLRDPDSVRVHGWVSGGG